MAKEFKLKEVLDKVEDVVKELKNNDELREQFKDEPVETLEKLTGLDLPDEKVKKVVDLIEAKIDDADVDEKLAALGDKLEDFGDDLKDKVGGFFKKFDRD
jgi:1,2-phenylacetyl-CoA epoxidase catalytic subunit